MRRDFEDSIFSRSNDMKEDPRRKNRGDLGWLRSLKVTGNVTIQ